MKNLIETLTERGLISQMTDVNMAKRFETTQTVYCGFDPTADSLHVGSLIPLIALIHCVNHGHKIIPLSGDATAQIGDPSGKSEGRKMLDRDDTDINHKKVIEQIKKILINGECEEGSFAVHENLDWFNGMTFIETLRDVGSKMSVNKMLSMDSVKNRIESESGISFLEFSYMLLQAYDFLHLARTEKCFIQIGGQDQWGNIIMGIELARKSDGLDLAGITLPLVTKSDGTKFGKSESGNIWLDEKKTSVFDFFQFWRNTKDEDVEKFLKMFTFHHICDIDNMINKDINFAKEELAMSVTALVHGTDKAHEANNSAKALFKGGTDTSGIDSKPLGILKGSSIINLLCGSGLASTRSEAKRMIESKGVKINGEKIIDHLNAQIDETKDIVIQYGKKAFKFTI